MLLESDDMLDAFINQLRLGQLASSGLQVYVVFIKDKLVDIDLADSSRDATLCDRVRKSVSAM
jgi:hypothetical protein